MYLHVYMCMYMFVYMCIRSFIVCNILSKLPFWLKLLQTTCPSLVLLCRLPFSQA